MEAYPTCFRAGHCLLWKLCSSCHSFFFFLKALTLNLPVIHLCKKRFLLFLKTFVPAAKNSIQHFLFMLMSGLFQQREKTDLIKNR